MTGYDLTIVGNNFGTSISDTIVRVGNNVCNVTYVNSTQIICTAPPGAGVKQNVFVSISTVVSSSSLLFSYNAPVLLSYFGTSYKTDGSSVITIIGQNFGPIGIATVQIGSNAATIISQNDTAIVCNLPVN